MKHIDEAQLETDLPYRYQYLAEFIGFDNDDISAIHAVVGHLAPLVPGMVEQTYDKLLAYDATARHFVPRQHGFEGSTPESLETLAADHAQIQFRKEHLMRYLMHLMGHAYDDKMVTYLDVVGKIHTPMAGNEQIHVPPVQMNVLLGLLSDIVARSILDLNLDHDVKLRTSLAFNKLFWIQNDLINRHYQMDTSAGNSPTTR